MTARPKDRAQRVASEASSGHPAAPPPVRAVESFETFYGRELRSVVGLAYALSGSRSAAEDLAQDAFLAAHKRWDKVSRYEKPEAWVRRVVANMSVSMFRRKVSEAKALARIGKVETAILPELPAESEHFWQQVRALPNRQAQAVALHYLEDLSVVAIAEILECSPNTVKVHLHKGRAKLAARLGADLEGSS